MPDFTFTVSLRVEFQTDWTPLLMKQKKTASLSIFLWSGKSGNGEVQWVWVGFTWIKLDGPLFSISLNSDQETTPTLRCVAEFGNAGDGRDSCIQRPPPPSQLEKTQPPTTMLRFDLPVPCYNLWILLFHHIHILRCFLWKKKSMTRSRFHNVVLTLHTIVPRIRCHHHLAQHLAERDLSS